MFISDNINGILVGCDDHYLDGYNWVIKNKDWDTSSNVIAKILDLYKDEKDFHIYFYVYEYKKRSKKFYRIRKGSSPKFRPAFNSEEYRNKIFGFSDISSVIKFGNPENSKYRHKVEIENLRLFKPKVRFEEIMNELEYIKWNKTKEDFDNWSGDEIKIFGRYLRIRGLLLTKKDCNLLQSHHFQNF